MISEYVFAPTEEQLDFFALIESDVFPWYHIRTTSDAYTQHAHTVLRRGSEVAPMDGIVNSEHYPLCKKLVEDFCAQHNIPFFKLLRACVNSTGYRPEQYGEPHVDHPFAHKNFLLYLNDTDMGGTYFFNVDGTVERHVEQQKMKALVWDGELHAQGFCAPTQRRLVLVATFI